MRLLLDTHVLLWTLTDDPTLSSAARDAVIDGTNHVFASAASAWEIGIKKALGKLEAPGDLPRQLELHRFEPLPVRIEHGLAVEDLPTHHGDPFDRLLIAQAQLEGLTLVTSDNEIPRYDVATLET